MALPVFKSLLAKRIHEDLKREVDAASYKTDLFPHCEVLSPLTPATFLDGNRKHIDDLVMENREFIYECRMFATPERYSIAAWQSSSYGEFIADWEERVLMDQFANRNFAFFTESAGTARFELPLWGDNGSTMMSERPTEEVRKIMRLINRVFKSRFNAMLLLKTFASNMEHIPAAVGNNDTLGILTLGKGSTLGVRRELTFKQGTWRRKYMVPEMTVDDECDGEVNHTLVFFNYNKLIYN